MIENLRPEVQDMVIDMAKMWGVSPKEALEGAIEAFYNENMINAFAETNYGDLEEIE
jgi:hypothetical protein